MDDLLTIKSQCMALHLRRAARRIGRIYDDTLRPLSINNGQFSLLTMLAAKDAWTMHTLADALGLDQSSLSAAVKPLARRELLKTAASTEDRRVRTLALTPMGRALVHHARPLWRQAQDRVEQLLVGHATEEVRSALRALA